jgi:hypothetical protein
MASQVSSGFSTEGNQYAKDNSFYLLDTLPGAGDVIVAPVTIAGPIGSPGLIVQGTTTLQGAAAALSLNTNTITAGPAAAIYSASGTQTISSATGTTITAAANGIALNATGSGGVRIAGGAGSVVDVSGASITLRSSGNISSAATGNNALSATGAMNLGGASLGLTAVGLASVQSSSFIAASNNVAGGMSMVNQNSSGYYVNSVNNSASLGYSNLIAGEVFLDSGLAIPTGQGSFSAPATIPAAGGGGYIWQMTGNKAFLQTAGAAGTVVIVLFPAGVVTQNWIPLIGQIGVTSTNVAAAYTDGVSVILQASNILAPMKFSIALV